MHPEAETINPTVLRKANGVLLYLHRDVQGIHNLPNHEGQDVNNQQNPNGGIELPGLQVLLEYKKSHKSTFYSG